MSNVMGGRGTEIYDDTGTPNNKLASMIVKATAKAMGNQVRAWSNAKNGVNYRYSGKVNYYGVLKNNRAKSGMLLEICFHDNKKEVTFYKNNLSKIARAVADSIAEYYGVSKVAGSTETKKEESKKKDVNDVNIMGESELSASELLAFFNSLKVTPKISIPIKKFIETYLIEGDSEGVRGDIAFIQAIHETGKFQFGGDVVPAQNNFAGIGTTGGGVKGHYFNSPQEGIRAQIQHLKAYASKDPLKNKNVDPRFHLVTRGSAKTVRGLTGKWATDKAYGDKLMDYYNQAMEFKGEDDLKYNISILDKRDGAAALEVLFDGEEGSVISKGGNYKYGKEKDTEIVGIGKDRSSHTSYLGYFISGATAAETLEKAKDFVSGNKEKYKAPKKGR